MMDFPLPRPTPLLYNENRRACFLHSAGYPTFDFRQVTFFLKENGIRRSTSSKSNT